MAMTDVSKEYAEALFALAMEAGRERDTMTELATVCRAMGESPALLELLASPALPLVERLTVIERVFGEHVSEQMLSFLCLLCEKGRVRSFTQCVEDYRTLLDAHLSTVTARVTTAVPLTEEEKRVLTEKLSRTSGYTVRLVCTVDPAIMGGAVVEMDGKIMDGSLRRRLHEVKEVMNQ